MPRPSFREAALAGLMAFATLGGVAHASAVSNQNSGVSAVELDDTATAVELPAPGSRSNDGSGTHLPAEPTFSSPIESTPDGNDNSGISGIQLSDTDVDVEVANLGEGITAPSAPAPPGRSPQEIPMPGADPAPDPGTDPGLGLGTTPPQRPGTSPTPNPAPVTPPAPGTGPAPVPGHDPAPGPAVTTPTVGATEVGGSPGPHTQTAGNSQRTVGRPSPGAPNLMPVAAMPSSGDSPLRAALPGGAPGPLARTGFPVQTVALAGLTLMLLGTAVALAGRPRAQRRSPVLP